MLRFSSQRTSLAGGLYRSLAAAVHPVPIGSPRMSSTQTYFLQDPPRLGNQYLEDSALRSVVQRVLPPQIRKEVEPDLVRFGERVLGDILEHGRDSERNPPKLYQVDAWGRRVDEVRVAHGWKVLQDISAEEGIIAIAYERKQKEYSRLYQMLKVYLFAASSAVFDCPLAMTDGAARLIELHGDETDKREVLSHLTSRDKSKFWTSGQWMTERTGGSDVGNSETVARLGPDGLYRLTGYKFFTSASTSNMTMLLGRIQDKDSNTIKGSRGLSVFLMKIRDAEGNLNNLTVHKLKEKLGTKPVPTAEIELKDSVAKLVGKPQEGVKVISTILNITRIHNAVNSVATMRRALAVARDYAHRRHVFGVPLSNTPLHLQTLAEMEIQYRANLLFMIDAVLFQGKADCGMITADEALLLRLLTPLLKLYAGKQAVAMASEGIEALGGIGYMEDSDMPRLLRDTQVGSIWEGTTNLLSIDALKVLGSDNAWDLYSQRIKQRLTPAPGSVTSSPQSSEINNMLSACGQAIEKGLSDVHAHLMKSLSSVDKDLLPATGRNLAFSLARLYCGSLLIDHARWSQSAVDAEVARRWCLDQALVHIPVAHASYRNMTAALALDIDPSTGRARGAGNVGLDGKPRARY